MCVSYDLLFCVIMSCRRCVLAADDGVDVDQTVSVTP